MTLTSDEYIILAAKLIDEALEKEDILYKGLRKNKKTIVNNAMELLCITNRVIALNRLKELFDELIEE